jgi:threonine 3-dehydrogenase
MMKALAKLERAPGLTLTDVKTPEVGHNDVMIRIRKTAICGTDIHIWKWDEWARKTIPVPMQVGPRVRRRDRRDGPGGARLQRRRSRFRRGSHHLRLLPQLPRRAPSPVPQHRGRGRQSRGRVRRISGDPAFNAFRIPDDISDDLASIFDPFGNATHTALSFNLVGEDVLITGAGPIGIMAAAIARHVGARHVVITDVNDYRLALARKMGATRAVNIERENLRDVMTELG